MALTFSVAPDRGEAAIGVILVAVGAYAAWGATDMTIGTAAAPGAGFFPLFLGILLALAGIGVTIRALRLKLEGEAAAKVLLGHRDIYFALLGLAGLALLFERLGLAISGFLFLTLLFKVFGRMAWWKAVLGGLVGGVLAHLVFITALDVQLPRGPFFQGDD